MILTKIEVLKSMCGVSLSKRSSQKRVFVCGINDEKFESFPKRRQENEKIKTNENKFSFNKYLITSLFLNIKWFP